MREAAIKLDVANIIVGPLPDWRNPLLITQVLHALLRRDGGRIAHNFRQDAASVIRMMAARAAVGEPRIREVA